MPWIVRGLRDGIVTTRYPRRPDGYGDGYRAAVRVVDARPPVPGEASSLAGMCPTAAIDTSGGAVAVDRGKCIVCGACVEQRPDRFAFEPSPEVAASARRALVVGSSGHAGALGAEDDAAVEEARAELARRVRVLRRSVHVRHVDAGSDGSEEWEVNALLNPVYDVHRLGVFFTASPRHADLLLVTGVGTAAMAGPLRRTWEAMPDPKIVLAAGTDAVSGGLVQPTYASGAGIAAIVPVDVWVPGSPPSPFSLLHGILLAVGLLPRDRGATAAIPDRRRRAGTRASGRTAVR
ncbi:MAG: NADH:ubiquinone oxidoreductase [Actinomycetota bacterium]|jgi:Ni,Fe-hydrogenase III small subunit/ferredoxin|nr:NADH:ubiquinone oxidoreductase [Actinomycetota bacterium]